jgi:hypothetical protein
MKGTQYLDEDVEIDPILLKAEKRTKHEKEIRDRANKISPDYRQRLHENGLDDVVSDYIMKGLDL